jgi:hypothetical protein
MARWKLRSRSKSTKDTTNPTVVAPVETTNTQQPQTTSPQEHPEETPVMEYNMDLYAQSTPVRKVSYAPVPKQEMKQRTSWENPSTIEQNIDRLGTKKTEGLASHPDVSDHIEKKVDRLIAKKKVER